MQRLAKSFFDCRDTLSRLRPGGVIRAAAISGLLAGSAVAFAEASAQTIPERVGEVLRHRLTPAEPARVIGQRRVPLVALREFYDKNRYRPLWVGPDGLRNRLRAFVRTLEDAAREGLRPDDYASAALGRLAADGSPAALADLELLASHELVRFAGDLRNGRLSPRAVDPELFVQAEPMKPSRVLDDAAAASDFERFLDTLAPANPYYRRLHRVLADYRAVERRGGWPTVDAGPSLRQGDRDPRVRVLRERLSATRDITVPAGDPTLFDAALDQAVRRFQARHGLEVDGIVGPNTRAALNAPVETRLQQIVVNMERWRWMPDDLGRRYVLVNLAGFELDVVEDGRDVLNMRVVVGKPYRRTPVFTDRMTYIEFNPTWTVPPTIARVDILPKLREDPGYLAEENMLVYRGWDADAPPVDPATIDWQAVDPRRIPYRIVQQPGPKNALGRVKFMFPNRFHVYLHDTPSRELFERTVRTFSSGCIRIEKPLEMAEYMLDGQQGWTRERIETVIAGGERTAVPLARPLPVYLTYSTVWVGEGGTVHFRSDIYGRDRLLSEALYAQSQRSESL